MLSRNGHATLAVPPAVSLSPATHTERPDCWQTCRAGSQQGEPVITGSSQLYPKVSRRNWRMDGDKRGTAVGSTVTHSSFFFFFKKKDKPLFLQSCRVVLFRTCSHKSK